MKAYITIGLPASGKSTKAKQMCADDPNLVRANLDSLRMKVMFEFGIPVTWANAFTKKVEQEVGARHADIITQAAWDGKDLIIDDCHISPKSQEKIIKKVEKLGYEVEILDFRFVPLQVCIDRNRARKGFAKVTEKVIIDLHNRFVAKSEEEKVYMPEKTTIALPRWEPTEELTNCVIFDIDGTLAEKGDRFAYNESLVFLDSVREHVLFTLKAYLPTVPKIFIFSGRQESCREETLRWLREKCGLTLELATNQVALFMRAAKDQRRDSIIKKELFEANVKDKFNVIAVFDDRQSVIRECWAELGLPVFRCGVIDKDDF